ncbi:GNAT family N-acetyltransferase [Acidihalobacter ferrooxydans]|uniref:GNAT family N-acetyltransferase n=1 Tax=Acidihalobacter ferrooxydans TaxID=1765967 RepID=A0A1P8UHX4_9GAMM|nr:GNAT family N-acetyltransferase [Acidihalobacter ferrooxydans]APZ43422.1 GNAT family N-acetyltransferase [Acidihalobacter ferrooxydans]
MALELRLHRGLGDIAPADWDRLGGDRDPFLSHAFLRALETTACLEPYGWHPHHLVVHGADDRPLAAMPLYLKTNSYGEFVFDWSWAGAYERQGIEYYPKLVSSIPYTPATGQRLLFVPDASERDALAGLLVQQAIDIAQRNALSGAHWLFTPPDQTELLHHQHGLMRRMGCQYHWHNHDYADFDAFLADFTAQKRKKLRRERRRAIEEGVTLHVLHGDEADAPTLDAFHRFYLDTFEKHMGIPTLSREFFHEVAAGLGRRFVLVMARHGGEWVAGAVNFRSDTTLYGRYWGCREAYHSLHFETCYYQGIDYCIAAGLQRFEPGAQGEHKISRGFLPTPTWSAHWIANEHMRPHLEIFCSREERMMQAQCAELRQHSPFRQALER